MKIISGGQTGADRAGLDVAILLGIDYGGSIPKGRLTEEGPLDSKYTGMTELDTASYPARTEKNVEDADATLIFTIGPPDIGTALTISLAQKYKKPFLHIDLREEGYVEVINKIKNWIGDISPGILNIAGSRESKSKGIYKKVFDILKKVLE